MSVEYSKNYNQDTLDKADFIITTSSIICHETEIEALKDLISKNKKIFVTGIFANVMKEKYGFHENIYVIPFSFPVVPKGQARIRVQLSSSHTKEQLQHSIRAFKECGKALNII